MDTDSENGTGGDFILPKKTSKMSLFLKQVENKAKLSIKNAYEVLSDSKEELEEEHKRKRSKQNPTKQTSLLREKPKTTKNPKKSTMPPIVMDGITTNHKDMIETVRGIVKGTFTVKHTNKSTILFINEETDYNNLLASICSEKISHHTYTNKIDKSHAFVLRGLSKGTTIEEIDEDMQHEYDIKPRQIYQMTTKDRPLFLIITDPSLTLDFMNKNVRVILNTRIIWELRRSTKSIIQCHNCQGWGHATSNCGRQPKCLKCAGDHLTRICTKTRETAATCANCGGDHPANFTKCKHYTDRLERIEARKPAAKMAYIPAPTPRENIWKNRAQQRRSSTQQREEFFPLPVQYNRNRQEPAQQTPRPIEIQTRLRTWMMGDVNALNRELGELNKLVNISQLTLAIRELNEQLRQFLTNLAIFYVYQDFNDNIDKYNFRN